MTTPLNSQFYRVNAVAVDEFGIDPLKDRLVPLIHAIRSYTTVRVTQAEQGAPDLIAYNAYGTEDPWWVILEYNGIGRYQDIVEGLTLKIPDLAELVQAFTEASARRDNQQRVITI